jgi:hypothetical protein
MQVGDLEGESKLSEGVAAESEKEKKIVQNVVMNLSLL